MEIIPAIDIKNGRCVRLYQGDFAQATVYDDDPQAVAQRWVEQGAERLHLVDLDGARAGHPVNIATISSIARSVAVPVQLGGGLRTQASVKDALKLGVARVILGTAAVQNPDLIAQLTAQYGDAIIVGVDARDGIVATDAWTEAATIRAVDLADQMKELGVRRIIYTDIARDGTLTEPNYAATAALVQLGGMSIIASGGVCRVEHLYHLKAIGVEGAIIGRALYTGDLRLQEAIQALGNAQNVAER